MSHISQFPAPHDAQNRHSEPGRGLLGWLGLLSALFLSVALVSSAAAAAALWVFPAPSQDSPNAAPDPSTSDPVAAAPTSVVGAVLQRVWPLPHNRFTVLLIASDRRPDEPDAGRTDTMILASLDPVGKTAALVSLPRDLWVSMQLPSGEIKTDRLNSAYLFGEATGYPGRGLGLLKDTITANLGITIDRSIRVEMSQFPQLVDTLGGVMVDPPVPVEDGYQIEKDGPIIPLYFPAGPQRLTGDLALWYARTRHQDSDFGRMGRQQEVLLGLKQQALQVGTLTRLPDLWRQFSSMVQTNLTLPEILSLAPVVLDMPRDHITNLVIDERFVTDMTTPEGWQVLDPKWDEISAAVHTVLYDVQARGGIGQVEIINQSGRAGLGQQVTALLNRQGIAQTTTRDGDPAQVKTVSIVRTKPGRRLDAVLVARLLGLADGQVEESLPATRASGPAIQILLAADTQKLGSSGP